MRYWINRVLREDQRNLPILLRQEKEVNLLDNTVLSVGDQLRTRNGWVEVRDDFGLVIRLGPGSELAYALDPQGGNIAHPLEQPSLIFFGEVYKFRYYVRPLEVVACGKYRTSCWYCPSSMHARNLDENRDAFYALAGSVPIWDWDEKGESFVIVEVPKGHKAVLRHDSMKPMRKRYIVEEVCPISSDEWIRIASNYMDSGRWAREATREVVATGS
ncbi:hypothetical protein [Meiothermus granaticius]|uniref:Uncharacterized protein n=1 Tax=Meiothermus granaticius NBRC 107808 TaxID=1227551 RepID=A0A399FAM3_9DEIN|nr:hypothetical protein [Meiothermus granaticius]RIH91701.1 hypothetical protein Mgrana_02367 [Meiothermus granaticius NBRC 107808]GEM88507.1 hypothetical protein MGR01S_31320 [Meiothermus granaticius NBRC 107808]